MTRATKIIGAILALALVVIVGFLVTRPDAPRAGITNQVGYLQQLVSWFSNTVYFGTTQQASIDGSGNVSTSGDLTVSGGTVSLATSNTATSTLAVGCIQTVATSTVTPIRLVISTTPAATGTFQGTNANFTVLAQYGSCPSL